MMETRQRITDYFTGRPEVSALYVSGDNGGMGIAVLLKDAGLDAEGLEALVEEYRGESLDLLGMAVEVTVLNSAPPELRHRVLRTWELALDRNRSYRLWFTERTLDEYLGREHPGAHILEPEHSKAAEGNI